MNNNSSGKQSDIAKNKLKDSVVVKNVSKIYGQGSNAVKALDNISLSISDNEFFTLLGPSGCGKTTLLRLIAGFEQPSGGNIELFGKLIDDKSPDQRPINTVFQHYALFPHMSIIENVAFGLRMKKTNPDIIQQRAEKALNLVKMEQFANRKPNQLSGGQQQRIALARALAPEPEVLLLDEPLSALDLKLRQAMREELKTLQKETGITFIFVTHDQEEALAMSDRIAVMSEGEIQQCGSPYDIYEQPFNRFVADFIGDTNFIDAHIHKLNKNRAIVRFADNIDVEIDADEEWKEGEKATLALRPEKIHMLPIDQNMGDAYLHFDATILKAIYLGTDTNYNVMINQKTELNVRLQNDPSMRDFSKGAKAKIVIPKNALRLLED
ncbi:MAG: ABC transporter ATP-binding protein [Pseudomonadota bacterium]